MLKIIDQLPDQINLTNNPDWEIKYKKRFVGDRIIDVPDSIVHVLKDEEISFSSPGITISASEVFKELGYGIDNDDEEGEQEVYPNKNPHPCGSDEWVNWKLQST